MLKHHRIILIILLLLPHHAFSALSEMVTIPRNAIANNFIPTVVLPAAWAAKLAAEAAMLSLGLITLKILNDNRNKNNDRYLSGPAPEASPSGDPEDPEDKKKHPHGRYEDAPYHHANSRGVKNPAPKDGQGALDNSIQITGTSPRRIGVSDGEIVVLTRHGDGLFHGHVRLWNELVPEMKAALEQANLVNNKGKIL